LIFGKTKVKKCKKGTSSPRGQTAKKLVSQKKKEKNFFIFIFQRLSDSNKSLPSCSFFFFSLSTHFPVCCLASFLPHKDRRNPTLEGEQGLSLLLLFGGFFSSFELSGISSKKHFFFFLWKEISLNYHNDQDT